MAKGQKTGGRKAGTPNKLTSAEASVFEALAGPQGEAFAQKIASIAMGEDAQAALRAIGIAAPYIWKKLPEAHEHSGPGGGPIVTTTVIHEHRKS